MVKYEELQELKVHFPNKPLEVIDSPISDSDGDENDVRSIQHKGKFYMAMKIRGQWRYFQETKLAEV